MISFLCFLVVNQQSVLGPFGYLVLVKKENANRVALENISNLHVEMECLF